MISHVDNLRMLIATIGDENELPAKRGTLDSSTGEDGICIFDGVVGTRDEDARAVGVAGSANVGWDLMTMMKTVDLRNQDVRRSNLRGIKESWRGDEYGFENLVVEDVDFVVDIETTSMSCYLSSQMNLEIADRRKGIAVNYLSSERGRFAGRGAKTK